MKKKNTGMTHSSCMSLAPFMAKEMAKCIRPWEEDNLWHGSRIYVMTPTDPPSSVHAGKGMRKIRGSLG
jgi:hypothetical protein